MEIASDIKLAKFEIMLKKTCQWLYPANFGIFQWGGDPKYQGKFALLPFYLPITNKDKIDAYLGNMYFSKVYDICFLNNRSKLGPQGRDLVARIKEIQESDEIHLELLEWTIMKSTFSGYQIRGGIVFWALVLAAIDEEFYENEISMIADLAYLLKFNEAMMADWIKAVKYLLDGNMFSKNMNIDFKTKEANLFFKHIGKKRQR